MLALLTRMPTAPKAFDSPMASQAASVDPGCALPHPAADFEIGLDVVHRLQNGSRSPQTPQLRAKMPRTPVTSATCRPLAEPTLMATPPSGIQLPGF